MEVEEFLSLLWTDSKSSSAAQFTFIFNNYINAYIRTRERDDAKIIMPFIVDNILKKKVISKIVSSKGLSFLMLRVRIKNARDVMACGKILNLF